MADEADLGNQQAELNQERSIRYAQLQASKLEVEPKGSCLYCGERYEENSNQRWCDSFCRDLYEKQRLFKR